jgi:hypothetical protein
MLAVGRGDISNLTAQNIAVTARTLSTFDPSQPGKDNFGRLTFRGGVLLSSPSDHFGGYSALAVDVKGERFLAVADTGSWLTARIERMDGQITGIAEARIGPITITQSDGRPVNDKSMRDVEGLVQLRPGSLEGSYLLTFEGKHRVSDYVFENAEFRPVGDRPLPKIFDALGDGNEGLEGATLLRRGPYAGRLELFAEAPLATGHNLTGALLLNDKFERLTLKRHEEFAVSDVQSLADGSLVFLERSFDSATKQQGIRLRLVAAEDVKPDTVMEGEMLLDAKRNMATKTGHEIDNFEGLAVHETLEGETILTLISDDNFSSSQRTMLIQFKLQ